MTDSEKAGQILKLHELTSIQTQLFNIANDFAGEETGNVAVALHIAASMISIAKRELVKKGSQEPQIMYMASALKMQEFI